MLLCGSTSSGKSCWMNKLLTHAKTMINPSPERITWCYKRWQPLFSEIQQTIKNIVFVHGIPEDLNDASFYAWLLGGYASLLCGYDCVVPCLFLLCLSRASFLENSISHSVQVVDIVETLLNTSYSFNCSDQNDKNVCSVAIYILQWR
jgi:GTPase SAR1 family protein